jgi:hypothetical protein
MGTRIARRVLAESRRRRPSDFDPTLARHLGAVARHVSTVIEKSYRRGDGARMRAVCLCAQNYRLIRTKGQEVLMKLPSHVKTLGVAATALAALLTQSPARSLPTPANLANWSDLKCYQPLGSQAPPLNVNLTISQLNPRFLPPNANIPDHNVQVNDLQQLCVPVDKNDRQPPADTLPVVQYFDLACYNITVTQGNPALPGLILWHRNPVLTIPPVGNPNPFLPVSLSREAVKLNVPPSQLCVPVAKNGIANIPPEVLQVIQFLDFECYDFSTETQLVPLNLNLSLTHLNPVLVSQGQPKENVFVTTPRQICTPVNKNHFQIPSGVLPLISHVDLKKYDITSTSGGNLPPMTTQLTISQLDPLLTTLPAFSVNQLQPKQLALPVHKCNPFKVTSQTVIPPDNPFSGPLYFNLQSNCPGLPRTCGGFVTLPAGTTATSKCNLLVAGINAACGGVGFVASTPDACASASFDVVDSLCNPSTPPPPGSGLMLGLSNDSKLFTQEVANGVLPDYEQDLITPGCGGTDSHHLVLIKGNPSGVPFITGSQPSVVFASDLSPFGGFPITFTVAPTTGMSTNGIIATGLTGLNQQFAAAGIPVSCNVVGGRGIMCDSPSGEPIPVGVQINDTGLSRGALSGAGPIVQSAGMCIDSGNCPKFETMNFVATSVPAQSRFGLIALAMGLVAVGAGLLMVRRALVRHGGAAG